MRASLKRLAETLLLQGGAAALSRRRVAGRTLILAYHNILPEGSLPGGDRSLHLPERSFAAQLDMLVENCEVVALGDPAVASLRGAESGRRRPRVAITFDDAYQGAVTIGLEQLRRRSLPATIFVAPAFVGGKSFWWDAISEFGCDGLSATLREAALTEHRGEDALIRAWADGRGLRITEPASIARAATTIQLDEAMRYDLLTLGSHTWSHPNLSVLGPDRLDEEMSRSAEWLRSRYDRTINWVSFPYGLSSPAVTSAAMRAGYEAGLLVQGGWMLSKPESRFLVPRFNVPAGLSDKGFALRLAGMFSN